MLVVYRCLLTRYLGGLVTKFLAILVISFVGTLVHAKNSVICPTAMLGPGAGGQTKLVLQRDSILRFYTNLTFQNQIMQQTLTFDSTRILTDLDLTLEDNWGNRFLLKFGDLNKCEGQTTLEVQSVPNAISPYPKVLQSMVCECTQS